MPHGCIELHRAVQQQSQHLAVLWNTAISDDPDTLCKVLAHEEIDPTSATDEDQKDSRRVVFLVLVFMIKFTLTLYVMGLRIMCE